MSTQALDPFRPKAVINLATASLRNEGYPLSVIKAALEVVFFENFVTHYDALRGHEVVMRGVRADVKEEIETKLAGDITWRPCA